jgi:hypothetical protein
VWLCGRVSVRERKKKKEDDDKPERGGEGAKGEARGMHDMSFMQ